MSARRASRQLGARALTAAALTAAALTAAQGCADRSGLFIDVAEEQELEFVSYSGDHLWYLIDTMGSGTAAGDYDGDGDPDIYLCTGHALLDEYAEEAAQHRDALWRNDGAGRFTDVTRAAGLGASGWSHGAVFADYDDDGDLDLYVTRHGPNLLYQNRGDGTFEEVGARAGVAHPGFSAGAAFADFDADGDLDLYVANYARYDLAAEKGRVQWFTDGIGQFPQHFPPEDNVLYRNDGRGTFTDITEEAGAAGTGRSLGVLATDVEGDGDLDIFVANDVGENDLLVNQGGRFREEGLIAGVALNADGNFEASMGVAGGDYDNDGDVDILVTNYGGEQNTLYENLGGGVFADSTRSSGLVNQTVLDCVGWGAGFYDFDNDGFQDLLVVNGHVVANYVGWYMEHFHDAGGDIPQMRPEAYRAGARQTKLLFRGGPGGRFTDITGESGYGIESPRMARGAAFADFDGDGGVDVAVTNKNEAAQVLINRFPARGNWVVLDLRTPRPNVFAVGARVRVRAAGRTATREVYAGTSYLSGDDFGLHFGLGEAKEIEWVEVRWPDGTTEIFHGLEVNRRQVLRQGEGVTAANP
jgi:hypothetical protein